MTSFITLLCSSIFAISLVAGRAKIEHRSEGGSPTNYLNPLNLQQLSNLQQYGNPQQFGNLAQFGNPQELSSLISKYPAEYQKCIQGAVPSYGDSSKEQPSLNSFTQVQACIQKNIEQQQSSLTPSAPYAPSGGGSTSSATSSPAAGGSGYGA